MEFIPALIELAQTQGLPLMIVGYVVWSQTEFIKKQSEHLEKLGDHISQMVNSLDEIRNSLVNIFNWQKEHDNKHLT